MQNNCNSNSNSNCNSNSNSDSDSDSDNDDWYNRMEAAAHAQLEVPVQSMGDLSNQISDEDYYARLEQQPTVSDDSGVITDTHPMWHKIMKDLATENESKSGSCGLAYVDIDLQKTSSVLLLRQWLFSSLPLSSNAFVKLQNESNFPYQKAYTDNVVHPSMVLIEKFGPRKGIEISFHSPYTPAEIELRPFVAMIDKIAAGQGTDKVMFAALEIRFYEYFQKLLHGKWSEYFIEHCGMYTFHGMSAETKSGGKLPDDYNGVYSFCQLRSEDADLINERWVYSSEGSIDMVREMIRDNPAVGIKVCSAGQCKLVTWCLTYSNGAFGMLHTLPEHRGKGLGKAVVGELLKITKGTSGFNCAAFCFIEKSNDPSIKIFQSLGFSKCTDVVWAGMIRGEKENL